MMRLPASHACLCLPSPTARMVSMRPVTADRLDAAAVAPCGVFPRRTPLKHAEVAQGEIVLGRILGIELAQNVGDLLGGFPGQRLATRQAEVSAEFVDVGIDRDEQHARRNVPEAEVDAVRGPHHPAQVEQEPLAATRSSWVRENVRRSPSLAVARSIETTGLADRGGKRCECATQIALPLHVARKPSSERPPRSLHASRADEQTRQILAPVHSVLPSVQTREDVELVVGGGRDVGTDSKESLLEL